MNKVQHIVVLAVCFWLSGSASSSLLFGSATPAVEEPFIGWAGETYDPSEADNGKQRWIEVVSWKPRAFIYHNFLTDQEAEHMKRLAGPTMKRSTVVAANGSSVLDDYRTSYGTFIKRKADPIITNIEKRIAEWARIPEVHAEDTQVLRYGLGQEYKPHMDTLKDNDAGPRVCTVLMYLNDVIEGGETAFPDSNHWVDKSLPQKLGPFSPCARGSVAFKPRKGDAFMFWSMHPDSKREDSYSMHTGCPVLKGVKWTATKWIHSRPFRPETFGDTSPFVSEDPGICADKDPKCKQWAKNGECQRNAKFMLGDLGSTGSCAKSCGACKPCSKNDRACFNENRRKAGYLVYTDLDTE